METIAYLLIIKFAKMSLIVIKVLSNENLL